MCVCVRVCECASVSVCFKLYSKHAQSERDAHTKSLQCTQIGNKCARMRIQPLGICGSEFECVCVSVRRLNTPFTLTRRNSLMCVSEMVSERERENLSLYFQL